MSNLFAWGQKQDLAFQQPIGKDPRRRHHVRFWRSEEPDEDGRTIWIGAATLDTRVGPEPHDRPDYPSDRRQR